MPGDEPSGCSIPETERRGITLRQLRQVASEIERRCAEEGWTNREAKLLEPQEVNLYEAMKYVILPATEARQCSYVELVAAGPQVPRWFVSHWWGEPVLAFVRCLEQHAVDRGLGEDAPYWVCAYANNQWKAAEEVGDDPSDSSFRRAMHLAEGTVSVLDRNATCYTRIWCSFEIWTTLSILCREPNESGCGAKYLYDVYTEKAGGSGAVGLTDGMAFIDTHREDGEPLLEALCREYQNRREKHFPMEMASRALTTSLESAEASQEQDKRHILNCIRGSADLNAEPPAEDKAYDEVNRLLAGKFATQAYSHVLKGEGSTAEHLAAMAASPLLHLSFDFCEYKRFQEDALNFMASLPVTLVTLTIGMNGRTFATSDEFAPGLARLTSLRFLRLEFLSGKMTSCDCLGTELACLTELRHLHLNFRHCEYLESVEQIGVAIGNMPELTSLTLNCEGCQQVSSVATLAASLACTKRLQKLHIDLRFTKPPREGLAALCQAIIVLESLTSLCLKILANGVGPYNEDFKDVAEVKAAIQEDRPEARPEDTLAKKSKACALL